MVENRYRKLWHQNGVGDADGNIFGDADKNETCDADGNEISIKIPLNVSIQVYKS